MQEEIITKKKIIDDKIKESASTWPISIQLGTKHRWVKGIQVCSNEGPRPFPRGDNYEVPKNTLKNIFSRITEPISNKLGTKHPWVKEIQVCLNKEQFNFQKEVNGFFLLLIKVMMYLYVFIDLNIFRR